MSIAFDEGQYVQRANTIKSPTAADELFAEIHILPAPDRDTVLKAIQETIVHDIIDSPSLITQIRGFVEAAETLKGTPQGDMIRARLEGTPETLEEGLGNAQVFLNLHNALGKDAHRFIQIYADEASRLSDAEFSSTIGLMKLVVTVTDRYEAESKPAPQMPRSNPFRKPGGPAFP